MRKRNLLFVFIWLIVIFVMSSFNANVSSNQSNFIVNIISSIFNINNIKLLSLIVRKLAHFTEYLILGILVFSLNTNSKRYRYYAFIFCLLYAISDEIHQFFVSGRACQIIDILIDSFGAFCGIILLSILVKKFDNR